MAQSDNIRTQRLQKLAELREQGVEPYANCFVPTHTIAKILEEIRLTPHGTIGQYPYSALAEAGGAQGAGRRALCQLFCSHPHHRQDPGRVRADTPWHNRTISVLSACRSWRSSGSRASSPMPTVLFPPTPSPRSWKSSG